MHTILGYKGAMGQAVLRALQSRNLPNRLVSRNPEADTPSALQANLLIAEEADVAIEGSGWVYLCIGLPYDHRVWETEWETIMRNVIDACLRHEAKLIFLDNVYLYTHDLPVPFDESTAREPASKKGRVRKKVADVFLAACAERGLRGLIARSADFYGKGATNSVFYLSFLERILAGKNPRLLSPGNVRHTFAYVDDNAEAMVELALCEACYGRVWHLPVGPPVTMNEVLAMVNQVLSTQHKNAVMPGFLRRVLPYFIPGLREPLEMQYQFEREYVMDDGRFKSRFPDFKVTPYAEGIKETVEHFLSETTGNRAANEAGGQIQTG